MIRGLLLAAVILAALAFFAGLLLAAQTVGVEAWHDSGPVPQSAFTTISTPREAGHLQGRLPTDEHGISSDSAGPVTGGRGGPGFDSDFALGTDHPRPSAKVPTSSGLASWWNIGPGIYAALPGYVAGTHVTVRVCAGSRCVTAPVVTSCQCYVGTPDARVVDLSADAFVRLAPLSQGLLEVTIR